MTHYTVSLLKDASHPDNQEAIQKVHAKVSTLGDQDISVFGLFTPLFGLATNELYLVTGAPNAHRIDDALTGSGLGCVQHQQLLPTVRPTSAAPRRKPGIYVFRWFTVLQENVDEIARLSNQAWVTFEGGFETEVQGLFRQRDTTAPTGKMLLLTQYRDLSVWEASRLPPAEARENFARRARLTIEATPIATRLVPPT